MAGTFRPGDMYYDMQLWMSTAFLSTMSRLLPFNNILVPSGTHRASLLNEDAFSGTPIPGVHLNFRGGILNYLGPVLEYIRDEARGETVFVTGHSLGGGLAKAVGSMTRKLAVSFEGPPVARPIEGLFMGKEEWADWPQQNGGVVNVAAIDDLVAQLGVEVGYTQAVDCGRFPRLPLVSCHTSIASVVLHNCAPPGSPFLARGAVPGPRGPTMRPYCPGLAGSLTNGSAVRLVYTQNRAHAGPGA